MASFPEESEGIEEILRDMQGLSGDIGKFQRSGGQLDMSRFVQEYPYLGMSFGKTWGQMVDRRLKDHRLKAIVSSV